MPIDVVEPAHPQIEALGIAAPAESSYIFERRAALKTLEGIGEFFAKMLEESKVAGEKGGEN